MNFTLQHCCREMQYFTRTLAICLITATVTSVEAASYEQKASINAAKSSKVLEASLGDSAALLCYYKGKPTPKISWSKGGKLIRGNCEHCAMKANDDTPGVSKLHVTLFKEEDFGEYTCKARNSVGFQRIKIMLYQEDKGKLSQCQRDRVASRDPRLRLEFRPRCDADGSYHQIQCSIHLDKCWCVDESGHKAMDAVQGKRGPHCTPKKYWPSSVANVVLFMGILMVVFVGDMMAYYYYKKGLINYIIQRRNKRA